MPIATARTLASFTAIALMTWVYAAPAMAGEGGSPSFEELARQAVEQFQPVSEAQVAAARGRLRAASGRLNERLSRSPQNGGDWRRALRFDELQAELQTADTPDLAKLRAIHAEFARGRYGSNLVVFADVREALADYIQIAQLKDRDDFQAIYEKFVTQLADRIGAYQEKPDAAMAQAIGRAIDWLDNLGRAPALVAAVRRRLGRPNLFVHVGKPVIDVGVERAVDRTDPVRDLILGTTIRGTGRTTGQISADLASNEHHAVIDLTFLGINRSDNKGYNGPVIIHSRGDTRLAARKRLYFNRQGLHALPARANAETDSTIDSIRHRRGRQIIERVAWNRAEQQKCVAEAIAADHAESRLEARMDAETADLVTDVNDRYRTRFQRPLEERGLLPHDLQFASDDDVLRVSWLQRDDDQLAATGDPPPVGDALDLDVRVHESMVNNMAGTALAGMTVRERLVQADVKRLFGELPDALRTPPGEEPWGATFAQTLPIQLNVGDGQFTITIRGQQFFEGDQPHPGMNVAATYRIEQGPEGPRAVRQGELKVFPPGFKPGRDRLGTRQQVTTTVLKRRFGKTLPTKIEPKPIVLRNETGEPTGQLKLTRFEAQDGWLHLGWKLGPAK